MPLSRKSCFISSSLTGMPALAKFIAMPPPIVPAPTTAPQFISRLTVSFARPGTLATSRSAKKIWRCDADSEDFINSINSASSRAIPSSKGNSKAARIDLIIWKGARKPRCLRAIPFSKLSNTSGPAASGVISRIARGPVPSASSFSA